MRILVSLILFTVCQPSFSGSLVVTEHYGAPPVAAHLIVRADVVVVPVTISADYEKPEQRFRQMQNARKLVFTALKEHGLDLKPGRVSISSRDRSSFFSKSNYFQDSIILYAIGKLDQDKTVFDQTLMIYRAIRTIKKPKDVEISLGPTALGIENPDQYRGALLKLISQQTKSDINAMGGQGAIEMTGLENRVLVTQVNQSEVGLYVNYGLSITNEPRKKNSLAELDDGE